MGNFNPKLPTKHTGTDKYITFFVSRNRQPTGSDYRQPETGNLYSIGTIWQVGKNPTTGTEGEMFILTKIVSNEGYWEIISGSSGTMVGLEGDIGGVVGPDPSGIVNVIGTSGQIVFDGNPLNNELVGRLVVPISIANGGTNATSMSVTDGTVYFDGTRLVTTATGTTGQILTSNGPGLPPSYQTNAAAGTVVIQVFTSNGTYTPTAGLNYAIVEMVGGGGGGGSAAAASAGRSVAGAGGGGGEYARGIFSSGTIGASQSVTIGSGGGATSSGGTTSLGSLMTALGGSGGASGSDILPSNAFPGSGGSGGTGGSFRLAGGAGLAGFGIFVSSSLSVAGAGGSSKFGSGGLGTTSLGGSSSGFAGTGYGSGGGGAVSTAGTSSATGGSGSSGIIVITEFI